MTDRPIIFSAPMVRALLAGRKTQTRRLAYSDDGKPTAWLKLHDEFNYRKIERFPDYVAGRDGKIYRIVGSRNYRSLNAYEGGKYPTVSISQDGSVGTHNVHALVCEAWYGPKPSIDYEVRHLDSDRLNSRPENLDWALPGANWTDRAVLGRGIRENHHAAKLTPEIVAEIRQATASQRVLAKQYGVAQSTIGAIKTGETWRSDYKSTGVLMPRPMTCLWVRESLECDQCNWRYWTDATPLRGSSAAARPTTPARALSDCWTAARAPSSSIPLMFGGGYA